MTKQEWLSVARLFITSRFLDAIEENELVPAGKITYQFSARGHELAQILLAQHLNKAHDAATVYYRSRPFMLGAGLTIEEAFAGPMGLLASRNGGRDIGVVHNLPPRNGVTVLPTSGDVGAQYTPAIGWAQAAVYRSDVLKEKDWKNACAVALGGDGSTATNGFWAALNIATTLNLPMIFFIEDNGYGISVPGEFQTPGGNIAKNLASFTNLTILDGDGAEPEETEALIAEAMHTVRSRKAPVLLRLRVPRLCGHSGADNQSYKPSDHVADEQKRDPLPRLRDFLAKKRYVSKKQWEQLEQDIEAEVRGVLATVLQSSEPDPATAAKHVFSDGEKLQKVGGLAAEGVALPKGTEVAIEEGTRMNLIHAVRQTIETELGVNNRLLVFGEDVGVKGGVHGATVDLQVKFGAERVFDTSLSEEGIIGRSVGMALAGLMPVPEIQFRKYADPATEQINDCGTIRWRTFGDFAAPMVVRIPVGYGKKTGDPWHSVSGEAIYAHTLGWRIAIPSNARDAVGLLRTALRGDDPTFFFEHRALLDTFPGRAPYPGDNYMLPFGVASLVREGTQATIVTWGEMVHRAAEAVKDWKYSVEIIDLRTIIPWDREAVLNSVRKTNRCVVLHEDTLTNGFGAEIVATIAKDAFQYLDAPVERLATADCPIPYNPGLMETVVPSVADIRACIERVIQF